MHVENLIKLKNLVNKAIDDNFDYDQNNPDKCLLALLEKINPDYSLQRTCDLDPDQIHYLVGHTKKFIGEVFTSIEDISEILGLPIPTKFELEDVVTRIDNLILLAGKEG